jgi:predicted phosphohydrolase
VKIFAIGDLHLGHAVDKPMDIFGPHWKDHPGRIAEAWNRAVRQQDLVLVPGDLSWAMRMEEVEEDLQWLDALPGKKLVIKGNHDYWWAAISKLRKRLHGTSIYPLQYDSVRIGQVALGGTRLWNLPGMESCYADPLDDRPEGGALPGEASLDDVEAERARDEKIFRREMGRLESSLVSMGPEPGLRIVMTHFPPTDESGRETPVTQLLERYRADICVFGHLHSLALPGGKTWDFEKNGTRYVLTSCDAVDFAPYLLTETEETADDFPC